MYNQTSEQAGLIRAYQVARHSVDTHTQMGAYIVHADITGGTTGCNGFPIGVKRDSFRQSRPMKYSFTQTAVQVAISLAAQFGRRTKNAKIYCPWIASTDDAKAIITAGIRRVVTHSPLMLLTPDRWIMSGATAFEMLEEAGVQWVSVPGPLNVGPIRFNGGVFKPLDACQN